MFFQKLHKTTSLLSEKTPLQRSGPVEGNSNKQENNDIWRTCLLSSVCVGVMLSQSAVVGEVGMLCQTRSATGIDPFWMAAK